jgi:hypothetical protein
MLKLFGPRIGRKRAPRVFIFSALCIASRGYHLSIIHACIFIQHACYIIFYINARLESSIPVETGPIVLCHGGHSYHADELE